MAALVSASAWEMWGDIRSACWKAAAPTWPVKATGESAAAPEAEAAPG